VAADQTSTRAPVEAPRAPEALTRPATRWGRSGDLCDVCCLEPLRALRHFERDALPLVEGAEAGARDRGVVNEDVLSLVRRDETVSLLTVEPLHLTGSQGLFLLRTSSLAMT